VSFSPDGRLLASLALTTSEQWLKLWDARTGNEVRTLYAHTSLQKQRSISPHGNISVSFSPDAKMLASASWDKRVKLWDAGTGAMVCQFEGVTDVAAVARASMHSAVLAFAQTLETTFQVSRSKRCIAWLADRLDNLTMHPSGRLWSGSTANHVSLFVVEGAAVI
jgi:WD40 repeat protein